MRGMEGISAWVDCDKCGAQVSVFAPWCNCIGNRIKDPDSPIGQLYAVDKMGFEFSMMVSGSKVTVALIDTASGKTVAGDFLSLDDAIRFIYVEAVKIKENIGNLNV